MESVYPHLYKTITLKAAGNIPSNMSASLALLDKCGVRGIRDGDTITFQFDAADVAALEKADDVLVIAFLDELHKIRSFSSANGKLVYASFNKDKKVQGKADKSRTFNNEVQR